MPAYLKSAIPPGPLPARRLIDHGLTGRRVGPYAPYGPEAKIPAPQSKHCPFIYMIGHGHTQTNTDSKTLYIVCVRVRLCGSVAILIGHRFLIPTSHFPLPSGA